MGIGPEAVIEGKQEMVNSNVAIGRYQTSRLIGLTLLLIQEFS